MVLVLVFPFFTDLSLSDLRQGSNIVVFWEDISDPAVCALINMVKNRHVCPPANLGLQGGLDQLQQQVVDIFDAVQQVGHGLFVAHCPPR